MAVRSSLTRRPRALAALATALLAAGCEHAEPFTPAPVASDTTFLGGSPARLTFSPGDDRTPSWLPDGSGIAFSRERLDRRDGDRCLAVLPATGGSIRQTLCEGAVAHADSNDLWESPAVGADGQLLYFRVVSWIGQQKQGTGALILARMDASSPGRVLTPVPYQGPDGRVHSKVAQLRWLSPTKAVYLAQRVFYEGSTFYPDTMVTGERIMTVDFAGATPVFAPVPGTAWASSVTLGATADTIYYTLGGDTRIWRQALATGAAEPVLDLGEIVRDVSVRGTRLVAVVGRSVLYRFEAPQDGYVQRDEGGDLAIADLATGAITRYARGDTLFRRPEIAPAGDRFVAEASPFAPVHDHAQSDYTALNHRPDLWLFRLQ